MHRDTSLFMHTVNLARGSDDICSHFGVHIFLDIFRNKMQNFTSLSNAFDILSYLKILPSTKGSPSLDFHGHIHLKTVIQHNHRRSHVSYSVKPFNHLASLWLGLWYSSRYIWGFWRCLGKHHTPKRIPNIPYLLKLLIYKLVTPGIYLKMVLNLFIYKLYLLEAIKF